MTREEAIEWIKTDISRLPNTPAQNAHKEALNMAIKALEQEPCDDAISRQIISDYVESHIQEINTGYGDLNKHTNEILRMIVDYIEKMESVTPQPKTGHWIEHPHEAGPCWEYSRYECSECHEWAEDDSDYCPDCGARMFVPQENEDKE